VLFEFITLEGAQAGLSWETVLRKRDRYRRLIGNPNFAAGAILDALRGEISLRR
jgi:DNA-3-methyladenine glycosylase I